VAGRLPSSRAADDAGDADASGGVRTAALALVWLVGLAAGFVAVLAAVARYGCPDGSSGLACRPAGSALGWLMFALVLIVLAGATFVLLYRSGRGPVILALVAGGVLAGLLALAWTLAGTS
jgi:hypothetical protein